MLPRFKALIFDVDGTIADTERDGHRVAFNMAFAENGLDIEWNVAKYGQMLKIAGGKERIRAELNELLPHCAPEEIDVQVKKLHARKTQLFMKIVESGGLPIRPGIARLVAEARQEGLPLAVASTSNEKSVRMVLKTLLGTDAEGWFDAILAGDVVSYKKPDPEIYTLCAERLGLNPTHCMVVEDSRNGLLSAKAAGMKCIVTVNGYTKDEEFSQADLVVDSLDSPTVTLDTLAQLF